VKTNTIFILMAITCALAACTVDDKDRCLDGYEWSPWQYSCVKSVDTGTDSVDTDTDTGEAMDTETNGVGVACDGDTDCAMYQADVCLKNPQTPDASGMCSIYGCTAADCGASYDCCDCTDVNTTLIETSQPFCVPTDQAPLLEGSFGCICE